MQIFCECEIINMATFLLHSLFRRNRISYWLILLFKKETVDKKKLQENDREIVESTEHGEEI